MMNASNMSEAMDVSFGNTVVSLLPVMIMVGMIMFIFMFLFDGESRMFGRLLHRWYVVIPLFAIPLFIIGGFDMWSIIIWLILGTVVGGLFLWWVEHDFELPKGDPVKKGVAWWKKKFRF